MSRQSARNAGRDMGDSDEEQRAGGAVVNVRCIK